MILTHISSKGGATILETLDGQERRAVPSRFVARLPGTQADVLDEVWERGAMLDIDFHAVTVSVDELRKAFHMRGLWSSADIQANPVLARAALSDCLGDLVKRILDGGSQ